VTDVRDIIHVVDRRRDVEPAHQAFIVPGSPLPSGPLNQGLEAALRASSVLGSTP